MKQKAKSQRARVPQRPDNDGARQTRREFIASGAKVAAGATALAGAACFPDVGGRWPAELQACAEATSLAPLQGSGRVVEIFDPGAVLEEPSPAIQADVVSNMLEEALLALAGEDQAPWSVLLPEVGPQTRLGIKVNCLNDRCATSVPFVQALVQSLKDGLGLEPERILVWDRRLDELSRCGFSEEVLGCRVVGTVNSTTDSDGPGYEADHCTIVSGKTTRLSRILTRETDLTINAPVLKTHGVSGVTAALKNVYGVIDNPGDFHKDLVTALPLIYALPPVRDRIKLTLLDALIAVTVGGTSSPPDAVPRRVLAAQDPLALDRRALDLVNQVRREKELGLADIDPSVTAWLDGAHALGLGARQVELVARSR